MLINKQLGYLFSILAMILGEPSKEGEKVRRILISIVWQLWKCLGLPQIIQLLIMENSLYLILVQAILLGRSILGSTPHPIFIFYVKT